MNGGRMFAIVTLVSAATVSVGLIFTAVSAAQVASGSVSGVVTTVSDPPEAVARAVVTLSGPGLLRHRGAVTDEAGRFRIDGLPAGRFTLKVEKPGYVTSAYGARRPARPGTPIAIKQGEHVTNLAVRIWRGAVLAGIVRGADGRPASGATMRAYRDGGVSTEPMPVLTNNGMTTDDQGHFRIFGLEPGSYVLSARPPVAQTSTSVLSDRRVDDLFSMLQRGQRTGFATTVADALDSSRAFAPTFYPGTPAVEQAQMLTVRAGAELGGFDFALASVPVSTVTGVIRMPDGAPAARATVRFVRWPRSTVISSLTVPALTATTGDDGKFSLTQVTPGAYKVTARWRSTRPGGGIIDAEDQPQWAAADIAVGTTDLSGVSLTLGAGVRVDGRVTFEQDGAAVSVPNNVTAITIGVEALHSGTANMVTGVRPDGTFTLTVLSGEPLRFNVLARGLESTWAVRSAMLPTGVDWLDAPVTIGGGTSLTVAMTTRRSELSGYIRNDGGAAAPDVFVVAFATDRRYWGVETRRVQAVRPAADGAFAIRDLPPGEYFLGALLDVDQGDWLRPGFLDAVATAAVKVTIAEGGKTVQDLMIGAGR